MTVYRWLILACWLIFIAYWGVSALAAKRTISKRRYGMQIGLRLIIIVLAVLVVHVQGRAVVLRELQMAVSNPLLGFIGTVLCASGIGLAIWARVFLGRNWGMPMSLKENPELVTGGPYATVRHPIYTGMLLAMVGSAIAVSPVWLIPAAIFSAYFIYSARQEEKLMCAQFPETYPAYMARTKMLIPFVL